MPSLADLIRMGKQYVSDALPGGTLNSEVNRQGILDGAALSTTAVPVLGDLLGLGADINRYATDPESRTAGNFALSGLGMLPFVPAMTAWHGSPHKFDKFSLDKIGTGEGAQAYGHGLYLAESPEVAMGYRDKLQQVAYSGNKIDPSNPAHVAVAALERYGDKGKASQYLKKQAGLMDYEINTAAAKLLDSGGELPNRVANGQLYKTDIPDEAVARFLDWDKPLSRQAPEVQAAFRPIVERTHGRTDIGPITNSTREYLDFVMRDKSAGEIIQSARTGALKPEEIAETLRTGGIPGIRYLDGGSRSAGQGSSNFVAFDPEMIRILERNGQALVR